MSYMLQVYTKENRKSNLNRVYPDKIIETIVLQLITAKTMHLMKTGQGIVLFLQEKILTENLVSCIHESDRGENVLRQRDD